MLLLSRRVGEAIRVGDGVTVRVVESKGGRVRLAIDAPPDIAIRRCEKEPFSTGAASRNA